MEFHQLMVKELQMKITTFIYIAKTYNDKKLGRSELQLISKIRWGLRLYVFDSSKDFDIAIRACSKKLLPCTETKCNVLEQLLSECREF